MKASCQALKLCWFAVFSFVVTRSSSARHRFQSTTVHCQSNSDCLGNSLLTGGETCHWLYDGCSEGLCMCDPLHQKRCPVTGKCINARLGGDSCATSQECPESMVCSQSTGLCTCHPGHMTQDRQHCLQRRHKLLGHACSALTDTCYQKAVYGYTSSEVECSTVSGRCECGEGWRRDGISCGSRRLGERGCSKLFQCESGAICRHGQCVCPRDFVSASPDDKRCIKKEAVRDLRLGEECEEIYERRYCAKGLVCHRCTDSQDSAFTCVRFRITALVSGLGYYSAGSSFTSLTLTWWSFTSLAFLMSLLAAGILNSRILR